MTRIATLVWRRLGTRQLARDVHGEEPRVRQAAHLVGQRVNAMCRPVVDRECQN
jgi:hypothetical protein